MKSERSQGFPLRTADPNKKVAVRVISPMDLDEIISGNINIIIGPPFDIAAIVKLFNYLFEANDIKIRCTAGSLTTSVLLAILLEKPMPFANFIMQIPGISVSEWVLEQAAGVEQILSSAVVQGLGNVPRMQVNVTSA